MSEYKRLTERYVDEIEIKACMTCETPTCDGCGIKKEILNRLADLEDKIEAGTLVELPCKDWLEIVFGDGEVFFGIIDDEDEPYIVEIEVDNESRITWHDGWKTAVVQGHSSNGIEWNFSPGEVGKTVFITREAAEARLKELEAKEE